MSEPVDRLSEVLSNLRDLNASQSPEGVRESMAAQIDVLRAVQDQMQMQLRLHDAQIASLREVIAFLAASGD